MNIQKLRAWLDAFKAGEVDADTLVEQLRHLPYESVGEMARLDHHRTLRQGFPEFIYAEGKTADQVALLIERMVSEQGAALATRVSPEMAEVVIRRVPSVSYDPVSRILATGGPLQDMPGERLHVGILTAGTSDIPVAEEAAGVAQFLGHQIARFYDVGVAGLHRLLDKLPVLSRMDALIVIAGMEGALPSVVGGLVAVPVVAVPTSVGYGANFGGVAPLLAMLNSCAAGILVMNVDNGFGAALAVHRMSMMRVLREHDNR